MDEILAGYRTLILRIEHEILHEHAADPNSRDATTHVEFGLTKLNLMLRQYLVILPALHAMVEAITSAPHQTHSLANPTDAPATHHHAFSLRTHGIHGCALLTFLYHHSQTGVPVLSQVYRRLLSHLDKVLLHQLINWMFYGVLLDPFSEFFIRRRELDESAGSAAVGNGAQPPSSKSAAFQPPDTEMITTVFDSLHLFHLTSSHPSSISSSSASSDAFDWDTSYEIVLPLLPRDYFPSMSQVHSTLFLGKAIRILMRGEKMASERRRHDAAMRRRREWRASRGSLDEPNTTPPTTRTRRADTDAHATSASTPTPTPLMEDLAPLLQDFHALRASCSTHGLVAQSVELEDLTARLTQLVSNRLYTHLIVSHSLLSHLDHLRRFVLLGDGSFVESLLVSLGDLLDRPGTTRVVKTLAAPNGPVRNAMREVGLREEEMNEREEDGREMRETEEMKLHSYPFDHLTFYLDLQPSSSATTGWQQLKFHYAITSPLDLILTPDMMDRYTQVMRFHLEVRRVEKKIKHLNIHKLLAVNATRKASHVSHQRNRSSVTGMNSTNATAASTAGTSSTRTLAPATIFALHLLRQRMFFFLTTLSSYISYDVLESHHEKLKRKILSENVKEFEQIRKAHEEYLNAIAVFCFIKDRVVSGALADLFETCLQFCTLCTSLSTSSSSTSSPSASSFTRLANEYDRQSCFLFTILTRKTDFTGGSGSFLHALVSKLDYNGYFTRQSRELGLNQAKSKQLVPTAKGTVLSSETIQSSLAHNQQHTNRNIHTTIQHTTATTPSSSSSSSSSNPSRPSASTFTPSHLHSQASNFAQANTRPPGSFNQDQSRY